MIKLLISLFMLILTLTSCKKEQDIHIDPKSHYVELDTHNDLLEFMKTANNKPTNELVPIDKELPDYQFEGVIKKEYVVEGYCSCSEHKKDDHKYLCANFDAQAYLIYCYTEENNRFFINIKSSLTENKITKKEFHGITVLDDAIPKSVGSICTNIDIGYDRVLANIYWHAETDKEWNTDYLYNYPSVYTEEEAINYYEIIYNEFMKYQLV